MKRLNGLLVLAMFIIPPTVCFASCGSNETKANPPPEQVIVKTPIAKADMVNYTISDVDCYASIQLSDIQRGEYLFTDSPANAPMPQGEARYIRIESKEQSVMPTVNYYCIRPGWQLRC